jgi:hypothetical protein
MNNNQHSSLNHKIEAFDNDDNPVEMKSLSPTRVIPYIPSLGPVLSFTE